MRFLQSTWSGEKMYLWESCHPLAVDAPLTLDSTSNSDLSGLLNILEDQDLVKYTFGGFEPLVPDGSSEKSVPISRAIIMDGEHFVDFVSSFSSEVQEVYTPGDSFVFWVHSAKLLLECLSRGLFYPSVRRKGATLESRWELIEQDEEILEKIKNLSDCMPGVAKALIPSLAVSGDQPNTALHSFIKISIDGMLRSFLRGVTLIDGIETTPLGYQTQRGAIPRRDSIILSWLSKLTEEVSILEFSALEQTLLEQRIKDWNAALRSTSSLQKEFLQLEVKPPFVDDPGDALDLPWTVEIRLLTQDKSHSSDDASAEVDAEKYDYMILREIGRVCPLVPFLSRSLDQTFSMDVRVTAEEAHQLLVRYQPLLKEIGVEVKAPSWWEESATALGLVVKLKPKEGVEEEPNIFSASSLVDFSWTFTVGETELTMEQFEGLLEEGRSLVYVGDRWVSLNPAKIKKNLEQIKMKAPQKGFTLFDALRLGLGGLSGLSDMEVVRVDSEGWIQKIIDFKIDETKDGIVPESFKGTLRPYQEVGLAWLSFLSRIGIGGCLADDMGLGKTIQVLALLAREAESRPTVEYRGPNLLIVPMSILGNWESEAKKFVPTLKVYVHHGPTRETGTPFQAIVKDMDLVITTYSILHRDYKSFRKIPWFRIILDEAQNVKNTDTKQTKAVRSLVEELSKADAFSKHVKEGLKAPSEGGFGGGGPLRLALTGTPLENKLQELWSILDFLNPGLLGSLDDFRKRYVNPIEKSREIETATQLGKLIKPFVLRRTKQDPEIAAELPDKIEMESLVHLTPEQASLYAATLEQMLPKVREAQGIHRKGLVLSAITKLKQICVHPALVLKDGSALKGRSGKLQMLEELLETVLGEGDRVLIFTQFAQWGHLLSPYLASTFDTRVPFFHGGLNRAAREEIVRDFQDEKGPQILVLSLKAGGFGLNLTRANQVVHLDQWWNPAIQNQATDRAYRIGQKSNVQVRTLISRGTLEEKINQLHKDKLELAQTVVGTTRNVITELSPDALEELLQLQTNLLMDTI